MTAGLLLWSRALLRDHGLPYPRAADILQATGAGAAQAYTRRTALQRMVATADRSPGRPPASTQDTSALSRRVLRFLMDRPGVVHGSHRRRRYGAEFRRFVLELRRQNSNLELVAFAEAVGVPANCLRAWQVRRKRWESHATPDAASRGDPAEERASNHGDDRGDDRDSRASAPWPDHGPAAMILNAYVGWSGSLTSFCRHVQRNLDLPWTRNAINALLVDHGLRAPRSGPGRRGARAPCGRFKTFFPDAQWVADGLQLDIRIHDRSYPVNLELVVDPMSGAVMGASLRDHEDSQAVIDAFRDSVATAGRSPMALLLDQRPCNFSRRIETAMGDTRLLFAGRGRPQSKAHVEGAFGLFAQTCPSLEITAETPEELARELARLVVQCWARTLNHRPRRRRAGRTRVQLHRGRDPHPSPARVAAARATIDERMTRDPRRRQRRWRRRRDLVRGFIADTLRDLDVADPDGYITNALAAHPFEAVLAGVAVYRGKYAAGTLPDDADGRYLVGVTRRIAEQDEGVHIAESLWHTRARARDVLVQQLIDTHPGAADPVERVAELVDHALAATTGTERRLWIAATARFITEQSGQSRDLHRRAARRIHAACDLPYSEQLACVRALTSDILPIA